MQGWCAVHQGAADPLQLHCRYDLAVSPAVTLTPLRALLWQRTDGIVMNVPKPEVRARHGPPRARGRAVPGPRWATSFGHDIHYDF